MAMARSMKSLLKTRKKFAKAENRFRSSGKYLTKSGTMKRLAVSGAFAGVYVAASNPVQNSSFVRDSVLTMISIPATLALGSFAVGRKMIAKANRINKSKAHLTNMIARSPKKRSRGAIGFIRKFGKIIPIRRKNANKLS